MHIYKQNKGLYILYYIGLPIYRVIVSCLNGQRLPDAWLSLHNMTNIGSFNSRWREARKKTQWK